MASDDLDIQLVNATLRTRRFIVYQTNAAAALQDNNTIYVWDSRLLEGNGGQGYLVLPTAFAVAGMSGEPPAFSLTAPKPGAAGECWSLVQATPDQPLTLVACTGNPVDPNVVVRNQVTFARYSGVFLKSSRLLFGSAIAPAAQASLRVKPSFWVALSDLRRGDPIGELPPASQSCEVAYEVPSPVTLYTVTANENPNTGQISFTVTRSTQPRLRR
jgi:hypothetical protein